MATNFLHGLTMLGNGPSIGYLVVGALIGMFVGVVPGLGGAVVLSIILVFVYHIDLTGTICLFLGAHAGSYYSASVTSILLNTPAHPEAFAVTFDGFPMAQRGEPGRALGISAASTCIGGFVGCGVLVGFLQIINELPGVFHPPEYVALVALAMFLVGTLGTDSVSKAIIAAGAGLIVASIGPSVITGTLRYSFSAVSLYGGISLVALALGAFAIPQMVMVFGTGTVIARQDMTGREIAPSQAIDLEKGFGKQVIAGVFETFRHWGVLIQGGLTGALTGIVPGIGGFAANFLSYGIAQQASKKRALFGTGIAEGIIAPEAASLSKEAGSMIPILGLGIPGGVGGALFIAALTIKSVHTGYGFTTAYPTLGYEIVWVIALSGLIGTVAGVLVGPQLAKVTRVPGPLIFPFIFSLSILGPFLADVSFFDVMEVFVFGIIGLGLRRLRYPLGSFILGLVLGPTLETNIYLTRNIYPGFTFLTRRPLADGIMLIALAVLASKAVQVHRESKAEKAQQKSELEAASDDAGRASILRTHREKRSPYPLLAPIMTVGLLATSLFFLIYGVTHYNRTTVLMPVVGSLLVAVPAAFNIPKDFSRYVHYRRTKSLTRAAMPATVGAAEGPGPGDSLLEAMGPPPRNFPVITDKSWGRYGQYSRELLGFIWLGFLIAGCWFFGFDWGTAIFMAAYGITCTHRFLHTLTQRIAFTVLSTVLMWTIAYEMFNIIHIIYTPKIHF